MAVKAFFESVAFKAVASIAGGSLVNFINDQGHNYDEFKEFWDKVKRLASNAFTDKKILEYQKKMEANGALVQ
jgi:hypothetical protein